MFQKTEKISRKILKYNKISIYKPKLHATEMKKSILCIGNIFQMCTKEIDSETFSWNLY